MLSIFWIIHTCVSVGDILWGMLCVFLGFVTVDMRIHVQTFYVSAEDLNWGLNADITTLYWPNQLLRAPRWFSINALLRNNWCLNRRVKTPVFSLKVRDTHSKWAHRHTHITYTWTHTYIQSTYVNKFACKSANIYHT